MVTILVNGDPLAPTLSTAEVAALAGASVDTFYAMAQDPNGPLQPLRLGRAMRWPTMKVLDLLGLAPDGVTPVAVVGPPAFDPTGTWTITIARAA